MSLSKKAIEVATQCWHEPATEGTAMDILLAGAIATKIDEYREALIWCSGSEDFGPGGKAHVGWEKIVKPLLE